MTSYLRYPHIRQDLLTFVAADDIWLAPTEGGRAWRLTDDSQPVRNPRFSPDGEHIAYVSFRDGHPEVYVVPVAGSDSPRRLTWWGAKNTLVLGWDGEGRVLVASHAGEKNLRDVVVKAVGLDGAVERLRYGPAWGLAVRGDGVTVLSTPGSRPPALWKRYRGGTAPRLWLDRAGDGTWERLLGEEPASLVDPMWIGDRLVFVSDRAGQVPGKTAPADEQANLWVLDDVLADDEPRQLTHQDPNQGYVRDASSDGERLVWHSRGRILLLEDLDGDPREVEVTLPGGAPEPFGATPTKNLTIPAPDHGADASLIVWRGNAYWMTHRDGPARALVADSSVRVREPALLGRTGYGVVVTDAEGEDALEVHHLTGGEEPRRVASGSLGRVLHLTADPAGERVATISHDGRVRLVGIADGSLREVWHSVQGEATTPSFSPDGRYLLWSQPTAAEAELHQLMILDTSADGPAVPVTSGTFHDHDPAFTRDGKHIVFLSERTFDPDYGRHEFGLSFTRTTRPWLIPIAATEPPPFGPSADGWRISSPEEDGEDQPEQPEKKEVTSPDLDIEGAEERAVPFPVPSGDYRRLETCRAGVLWIEEAGEIGQLGTRRAGVSGEPKADHLQLWSIEKRAMETVVDQLDDYAVSGDGRWLVVRHKDSVKVTPADRKPESEDPAVVEVDLSRLRFDVDPRAEWGQMFDENARLMRDHYWREDMNGVDWDAVVERWRPVVSTLGSYDDFVDLLWETVGELNTSHAYVYPPDEPGDKERRLGLLGADLSPDDDGWRLDRILPGESSDPAARSPLRAAGVDARPGDVIVSVDGSPVDPAFGPGTRLVGAASKPVELTLRRDGEDRRVVVVPLDDEEVLRYQDWVRSRREYVDEHSHGRVGYVHIPDMGTVGWAQLHRDLRRATRREALIVDVRYNRGGHTSQLVLGRLTKEVVGWVTARHYEEPTSYPDAARRGPVVLVANEFAGSDGDIINAAVQAVGLGPVVGVRTWGGVVGIDGRFDLVDGTGITQPRYAFWLQGKDWGVENYGIDPDIEVIHSPGDFFADNDPQLDRAIKEALNRLESSPAKSPPPMPDPGVG
ncbi:MAG TPA: PDZ domain-containing protein [Acidimicrobiia bacterium]|nr:PDZ domain-containing protein [Acidimicrobiia bacterium]